MLEDRLRNLSAVDGVGSEMVYRLCSRCTGSTGNPVPAATAQHLQEAGTAGLSKFESAQHRNVWKLCGVMVWSEIVVQHADVGVLEMLQ
jgi:hypothetical protein